MPASARADFLSWRGPALWLAALATLAATLFLAAMLLKARHANEVMRDLLARRDVAVDAGAPSEVILARINELLRRDRLDEAQVLLSSSQARIEPKVRSLALYNIANERTRQAAELVRKGDIDKATALINLAKSEYRMALRLSPDNWDTRYNFDVAMRIVRDLPQADLPVDESKTTPKKIWTDLPGVPKGLP
jgi:mxaK protein